MKQNKMSLIVMIVVCMIFPIISCGVSSQKVVKSDNPLQPDYELFYQYLRDQKNSIFSSYDGSETCIIRKNYDETNLVIFPDMNDVYYWRSADASVNAEIAAEKLVSIMLYNINEIPEEYRSFTLTDYNIYSVTCYSSQTVSEAMPGMKLPQDAWIFSPEYTFDYVGKTFFSERKDCERKGLIAEDGLIVNLRQGMPEDMYYVVMKQDNVWRMEKLSEMLLNID